MERFKIFLNPTTISNLSFRQIYYLCLQRSKSNVEYSEE